MSFDDNSSFISIRLNFCDTTIDSCRNLQELSLKEIRNAEFICRPSNVIMFFVVVLILKFVKSAKFQNYVRK